MTDSGPSIPLEMPHAPTPIKILSEADTMRVLGVDADGLTKFARTANQFVSGGDRYFRYEDVMKAQVAKFMVQFPTGNPERTED